jgi:ribosomal protein S27AE
MTVAALTYNVKCPRCHSEALDRDDDRIHCFICGNIMWLKDEGGKVAKMTGSLPAKRAKEIQARKAEIITAWNELKSIHACVKLLGIRDTKLAHEELELREGIIKKLRKLSDVQLKTSEDAAKAITRRNPWKVHRFMQTHKHELVETYENESHNLAAVARIWKLPPNTLRGNLIAWGIHKPEGKQVPALPGKSAEVPGKTKAVITAIWPDYQVQEPVLPYNMPCPKCGSKDVAGRYKDKQILHTCQWCWHDWKTEALK